MYTVKTCLLLIVIGFAKIGFAQVELPADSSKIDADKIFSKVEVEAAFPGGLDAWKNFLVKNLKTNVGEKNGAPLGYYTTVVRFIVSKDGELTDIHGETQIGYGMEDEVIRVIEKSGKWIPAKQNGRLVNAYRRQPVTFQVLDDDISFSTKIPFTFIAGADNKLSVELKKVKSEDLQLSISKGTIKQISEGEYIIHVNEPGRVTIELYNTKKDKKISSASFEVVVSRK